MSKLKISSIPDDRPVRIKIDLPAAVHRDLAAYAEILGRENGCSVETSRLIAPMLARFMASDRAFLRARRDFSKGRQPPIQLLDEKASRATAPLHPEHPDHTNADWSSQRR